jgi:hypothetical protein
MFPTDILDAILNEETNKLMEFRHLIKNPKYSTIWKKAYGKELGGLAKGIPNTVHGTNTIIFIPKHDIPVSPTVTYVQISDQKQKTHIEYISPQVATASIFLGTAAHPLLTCSQPKTSSTASFQAAGHGS